MGNRCHPFDAYVQENDDNWRLARAGLLYAVDWYPTINVERYLHRLDDLAVRVDISGAHSPEDRIAAIRSVLVEQEGFCGQTADFCDPQSSFLNRVIERKRGLPITLAAVWLDIARTLGWPLRGVDMPGRFLLGYPLDTGGHAYFDPFTGGEPLTRHDCAQLLAQCYQQSITLTDAHLEPVDDRTVLLRMLGNLRAVYCARGLLPCVERVLHRMIALCPDDTALSEQMGSIRRRICEQN